MKKILLLCLTFILSINLAACGDEESKSNTAKKDESFSYTIDDLKKSVEDKLDDIGNSTNLKIYQQEESDPGVYGYALSSTQNIILVIKYDNKTKKVKEITLGSDSDADMNAKKDLEDAFKLLIAVSNTALSEGQQESIIKKLGLKENEDLLTHTEVHQQNGVMYTFHGDAEDDSLLLQAKPK